MMCISEIIVCNGNLTPFKQRCLWLERILQVCDTCLLNSRQRVREYHVRLRRQIETRRRVVKQAMLVKQRCKKSRENVITLEENYDGDRKLPNLVVNLVCARYEPRQKSLSSTKLSDRISIFRCHDDVFELFLIE